MFPKKKRKKENWGRQRKKGERLERGKGFSMRNKKQNESREREREREFVYSASKNISSSSHGGTLAGNGLNPALFKGFSDLNLRPARERGI